MEAQVFYQEAVPPYSTHVKTKKSFETSEKTNHETKEEIYYLPENSFSSSSMSHSKTSLEFTMVTGQYYADEKPKENQSGEELLYPSDYLATRNSTRLPSPILPGPISDEKQYRMHETFLLNHTLNTITCSDLIFSTYQTKFEIDEMTNIEASSLESQEGEDNEDISTELPMSETVLEDLHKMNISQTKQTRYGYISNKDISPILSGRDMNEKKLKDGNMHLQVR
ncbi:hypothetical protein lerEdw1_012484 [Lerista edwardsae]|nr:hypothetical protein lerEdw1_012484 [Lerista edwardsae]